jgi:hypothetical protein
MNFISIRCVGCGARIKAPSQLRGQMRSCPGCGFRFVVQPQRIEDCGPALVTPNSSPSLPTSAGR